MGRFLGTRGRLLGAAATLVTVVGLGVGAQAAQAQAIGPDAFGYTTDEVAFTFEDSSQTGTRFLDNDDDDAQELQLPFGFDFYGTTYNSVFASTNALLTFGGGNPGFVNQPLTGPLTSEFGLASDVPTAAVLWDDWDTRTTGDALYFETLGSGSERRFVVQWNMVREFGNQVGLVTFQAVLFEGSNDIEYRYLDTTVNEGGEGASRGGSATVGIRDTSGHENGENLQWSHNEAVIADESALRFTTGSRYAELVLADEPQGYWRMGEEAGTTVFDSSPFDNDGTYLGGVTLGTDGALAGDPDTAASYDGVNDRASIPDDDSLDVGDSFTLEGWIRRSAETRTHQMFLKGGGSFQLTVMNAVNGNQVWLRKAGVSTARRGCRRWRARRGVCRPMGSIIMWWPPRMAPTAR